MRQKLPVFLLLLSSLVLGGATCQHPPTPKDEENARIHYDLGIQAQHAGDVRSAINEYNASIGYDPDYEQAENALGVLFHLSFRRMAEAEQHYKRALAIKPGYSEAKVNLGNLYLDQERYDEAIALYEEALKDMFYRKMFIAQNNEGWAYFKKGQTDQAMSLITSAVRENPEFCQGYRNLGLIYGSQNKLDLAQMEFGKVTKKCPESAEGYYQLGLIQLKQKQDEAAKKSFGLCRDKSKEGEPLLEECIRLAGGAP